MKSILVFAYFILFSLAAQAWPPVVVAEIVLQANRTIPAENLAEPNSIFDYYRSVLSQLRILEQARNQALHFYNEDVKNEKPARDVNFSKRFLLEEQNRLDQFRLEQNLPKESEKITAKKSYTEVRNSMLQVLNYNLVRHHRAEHFEGDPQGDFLKYLDTVFKKELLQELVRKEALDRPGNILSTVDKQIGRIKAAYFYYLTDKSNKVFQDIITGLLELEQYHGLKVNLNGFWKGLWIDFKNRLSGRTEVVAEPAQMCMQLFR